jgi:hypothetical protein
MVVASVDEMVNGLADLCWRSACLSGQVKERGLFVPQQRRHCH